MMLDHAVTPQETDAGPVPPPPNEPTAVTAPPGFRLDALLGTGGMSVVYAATQLALRRAVAVKYLRPDLPVELRARFRAEATAIAALDHPNVVRLYAVGEQAGRPYLVLELVPDGSLADRLRDGPMTGREAAGIVRGVAAGVGAAHAAGIVHRDLKPANVLLVGAKTAVHASSTIALLAPDARSAAGELVPKVTDFGLAKHTDDPAGPTAPGTVLGTPSYMAPEQTTGRDDIGPAADVYAVGAVLYECLTGRPPFRAATTLETLDLVRSADPVPPRQLQPGVSRDLETIALKCLRKEPAGRYATAADVAADLGRYLAGEPILARPVGPAMRAAKWCRRHKAPAALIAAAIAVPAGLAVGVVEHNARLQSALDARTAEKERADENYREARGVLRKMLDAVGDPKYADVPRARELRKVQTTTALDYFRTVAAQRDDPSPEVKYDAANADLEAADVYEAIGDRPSALAHARRAKDGFVSVLAVADRRDAKLRKAAATGRVGLWQPDTPAGLAEVEEAVRDLTALVSDPVATRQEQAELGGMENNLGHAYHNRKNFAAAEKWFRAAYDRRVRMLAEDPADRGTERKLAENALNLVNVYQLLQRRADATAMHEVAAGTLERLLAADPTDRTVAHSLAVARVNYSYTMREDGRATEAIEKLSRSVRDLEPLYRTDPTENFLRELLFRVHGSRGQAYSFAGDFAAAARDTEKVFDYATADRKVYQRWFVARARMRAGEFAGAVAALEENLRAFPPNGNWQEPIDGAETAAHMAIQARAAAAVSGGGTDPDSYVRLARRLLDKAEAAAGTPNRAAFLKDVDESLPLRIVRE